MPKVKMPAMPKMTKMMKEDSEEDPRNVNLRKVTNPVIKPSKVKRFGISNLKRKSKGY